MRDSFKLLQVSFSFFFLFLANETLQKAPDTTGLNPLRPSRIYVYDLTRSLENISNVYKYIYVLKVYLPESSQGARYHKLQISKNYWKRFSKCRNLSVASNICYLPAGGPTGKNCDRGLEYGSGKLPYKKYFC